MKQRRLLPLLALGVVYLVWGSTYLAIRVAVQDMPPLAAAFMRFSLAGLIMGAIAARVDRNSGFPSRRQLIDYSIVGVLLLGAANGLVMWAEQSIPSGITALIIAMVPLWLTLFDGLRPGGQPWTLRVWVGTLVGFAGVTLVVRPEGSVEAGHWLGMAALVVACIMWSFGSLYAQAIRERTPVLTAAAIEMLAASVFLALASLAFGEDLGRLATASASAWAAVLYLVAFGSLLAFTAFAYCLNELPASTVGTYAYVNPVVAVALGYLILDEPVSAGLLGGAALILIGVVVTTTARPKPTRLDAPDGDEHGAPPPEPERQAA